jgi:hypothetical protein
MNQRILSFCGDSLERKSFFFQILKLFKIKRAQTMNLDFQFVDEINIFNIKEIYD